MRRVVSGPQSRLERDDGDADVEIEERSFVLLQLQQVPAARQSTEVTVEDQQQPEALIVFGTMEPPGGVVEREFRHGVSDARARASGGHAVG